MIAPEDFLKILQAEGISFFAGVPDSLMKGFLACVQARVKDHCITANEGNAVAMAAAYYLVNQKPGLVYLQNSGLGNIINPLTSLADKEVYGIPMLLMIGWRGQPGKKDEPQHKKMGAITLVLLETLDIPYFIFSDKLNWNNQLQEAIQLTSKINHPVALVIEAGFFADRELVPINQYELSAEIVLSLLFDVLDENSLVVCTTGKIGRLFYSVNSKSKQKIRTYFLNVGAMGHTSAVAAAFAKFSTKQVVLLDGDGSLLMHMGALAVNGILEVDNFTYILLNNGAHQSVGGQPTAGFEVDFCSIAKACGFKKADVLFSKGELNSWLSAYKPQKQFVEIRMNTQMPLHLPRPEESFHTAKETLLKALKLY